MTRKRNPANSQLPPDCYRGRSKIEWRPKRPGGKRANIPLCPLDTDVETIWQTYLSKIQENQTNNLRWLLNEYMASYQFASKAARTRRESERAAQRIIRHAVGNDLVFGDIPLKKITRGAIRNYLDARAAAGAPVAGNREKSLISKAWNWALERDMINTPNPCKDVERNPEKPRDRYVTDDEYHIVRSIALSYPTDTLYYRVAIAMELAYLCRMRRVEILTARRNQVLEQGFDTKRRKGSRDTITLWSKRFRAVIDAALATHGPIESIYLLSNGKGAPIAQEGFATAWTRIMTRAVEEQGITPYTFHDLKAKGASDFDGDVQKATGHRSAAMADRYDRKKREVEPTD